jgi:hypothetical protein
MQAEALLNLHRIGVENAKLLLENCIKDYFETRLTNEGLQTEWVQRAILKLFKANLKLNESVNESVKVLLDWIFLIRNKIHDKSKLSNSIGVALNEVRYIMLLCASY